MSLFPSLIAEHRELGLVVAVLLGFGFGFVLERAGFGQATKLAAQFYLKDMTVFKVMFSCIVTAMLGILLASGLGLVELQALSETGTSATYLWPMLTGGLLLGAGFIIAGYCPGTSVVGIASGNVDALFAFSGVMIGSIYFAELAALVPSFAAFQLSGDQGHLFLYQLLGIPAPVLALAITAMAIACFIGAEKVEQIMAHRAGGEPGEATGASPSGRRLRRLAFAGLSGGSLLVLATLALPTQPRAATVKTAASIAQADFARRLLDSPWTMRVLDLRSAKQCQVKRIPGAECAPRATLDELGLAYAAGSRDLVLVGEKGAGRPPAVALKYPGRVLVLEDGFDGWKRFALTMPVVPKANATAQEREAYRFRGALHAAMMGAKPPPPPPAGTKRHVPRPKKKKGGGC